MTQQLAEPAPIAYATPVARPGTRVFAASMILFGGLVLIGLGGCFMIGVMIIVCRLDFNLVVPLENYKNRGWMTGWINNGIYTYVLLSPTVTKAQLEKQLPHFINKYMGPLLKETGFHFDLTLTPFKDIYFENASFDGVKHGDKAVVYVFLSIAGLILLIACINFMNLSTVRAAER